MKTILSVLLSSLSGKAGSVVAANWKGIGYIRELVIPANPQTAPQQEQRGFLSQVVSWWHDFEEQAQDECKRLISGRAMSGFNAFVARNLKDLADAVDPRMFPLNATVNPVDSDFAAVTGAGASKTIDLSWSQGEAVNGDKLYAIASESVAGVPGNNLVVAEKDTTLIETELATLTMGKAAQEYMIWGCVEHVADHTFSIARIDTATSKA